MAEPEALQSIMSSLHTLAALVSTPWHGAWGALSYANDPWIMGHRESSAPTFQPGLLGCVRGHTGLALELVLMHLQSTFSCMLCFN